ncbi:MAG: alpha/beta fold hydrolase, partial [Gemmatirosa sp.]|nr:alpha/beta fold hydrolase [Gemmatirosa sp.]
VVERRDDAPWTERVVTFGAHGGLVGILTVPTRPSGAPRAMLMANVGTHHRVGPYRLWVDMARALAADGWHVLRFDHAGLGDSAPRPDAVHGDAEGARDLREAMDWLAARHGIASFSLVGFCSGVDAAHVVAVEDARVAAAAFIDGHSYPTAGHRLRRVLRLSQGPRWSRWLSRRLRQLQPGALTRAELARDGASVFDRRPPTRRRFRADVASLAARGTRLLFVFTGTADPRFSAPRQLFETLGRGVPCTGIAVERYAEADHLFSAVAHRTALVARLRAWAAG